MTDGEATMTASVDLTLGNRNGLHARPAHLFVQTANSFASDLSVSRVGMDPVDGKSIMGMMMLAAEKGVVLKAVSEGPDCEAQLRAIEELIESNFGEQ